MIRTRPRKPKRLRKEYRLTKQRRAKLMAVLQSICSLLGAAEAHITMYNEATGRRYHVGYTNKLS